MVRMVLATATAALGPDFLPIRRLSRRSREPRRLWVWSVAQAASTRMVHRCALPCRVLPLRCLPADSWLPGHSPAQDARYAAVGNRDMSTPILRHEGAHCEWARRLEGRQVSVV